jgi:hypothetical protein
MDLSANAPSDFASPALHAERSVLPVLAAGAVSTAIALAVQHFVLMAGTSIMGWHINWVIPAGAMGLGIIASVGFGMAAWFGGRRITQRMLLAAAAVLVAGYFAQQYIEYRLIFPDGQRGSGEPISFFEYYDLSARMMRFSSSKGSGKPGAPLGAWGLGVRALQIIGFALGGLIVPFALKAHSYCEACGRYRNKRQIALVAAGIPDKLFANNSPERTAERTQRREAADAAVKAVLDAVAAGDGASAAEKLALAGPSAKKREANKADARIVFTLASCARCREGELELSVVTGQGKQVKTEKLVSVPAGPSVVEHLSKPI